MRRHCASARWDSSHCPSTPACMKSKQNTARGNITEYARRRRNQHGDRWDHFKLVWERGLPKETQHEGERLCAPQHTTLVRIHMKRLSRKKRPRIDPETDVPDVHVYRHVERICLSSKKFGHCATASRRSCTGPFRNSMYVRNIASLRPRRRPSGLRMGRLTCWRNLRRPSSPPWL